MKVNSLRDCIQYITWWMSIPFTSNPMTLMLFMWHWLNKKCFCTLQKLSNRYDLGTGSTFLYRKKTQLRRRCTTFSHGTCWKTQVWKGAQNDLHCYSLNTLESELTLIEAISRLCFIPECCFRDVPAKFTAWQLEPIFFTGFPCKKIVSEREREKGGGWEEQQHLSKSLSKHYTNPPRHIKAQVFLFVMNRVIRSKHTLAD